MSLNNDFLNVRTEIKESNDVVIFISEEECRKPILQAEWMGPLSGNNNCLANEIFDGERRYLHWIACNTVTFPVILWLVDEQGGKLCGKLFEITPSTAFPSRFSLSSPFVLVHLWPWPLNCGLKCQYSDHSLTFLLNHAVL